MPSPLSPESRTLLRLLADSQWHPLEAVKEEVAAKVPPGRALRIYERKEASRLARQGGAARARGELPIEEKLKSGRSSLANTAIASMSRRHVEILEDGLLGTSQIRIRPDALSYILAKDAEALREQASLGRAEPGPHDPEPGEPAAEPTDPAQQPGQREVTDAEDRIRSLVAEAVDKAIGFALDDFQYGMQRYLDQQFAEVLRHLGPRKRHARETRRGAQPQHPRAP